MARLNETKMISACNNEACVHCNGDGYTTTECGMIVDCRHCKGMLSSEPDPS